MEVLSPYQPQQLQPPKQQIPPVGSSRAAAQCTLKLNLPSSNASNVRPILLAEYTGSRWSGWANSLDTCLTCALVRFLLLALPTRSPEANLDYLRAARDGREINFSFLGPLINCGPRAG
jgi:hypothetical protein